MNNRKYIRLFVLLVFTVPVSAYAIFDLYEGRQRLPVYGPVQERNRKQIQHHIADFSLLNQDGEQVTQEKWKNKIVVADFFFTHCPSICPKMTNSLRKVNAQFDNDNDVYISSFTVDPENDSSGQLKKYAIQRSLNTSKWDLLTGDKREIYKLARNSFMIVATDGDGGSADFIHSEKLVLSDREGRIRGYYDGTDETEVNQLIHDIKKLKHEN
jgi:protein SCO1/2